MPVTAGIMIFFSLDNFRKDLHGTHCECLFFWVHGGMNCSVGSLEQKNRLRTTLCGSCDLFVPLSDSFPHEPRKKTLIP